MFIFLRNRYFLFCCLLFSSASSFAQAITPTLPTFDIGGIETLMGSLATTQQKLAAVLVGVAVTSLFFGWLYAILFRGK